jgi:type III restriction enzyme
MSQNNNTDISKNMMTRFTDRNVPVQTLRELKARLSLRHPQAESLDKLAQALTAAPAMLNKTGRDEAIIQDALQRLKLEFPSLSDFEREFPSLCFSLATGVGKTRLMGAFIAFLHLAYGINNFFVLAPNLTIYDKLISDFTPNTPKYVFGNLTEFNFQSPMVITGDNYDSRNNATASLLGQIRINVFNISKINSEVRGGKEPRIKRMQEVLGDSYFNHLANLSDLVLLMDESHRYRASAGIRAINELNPLFGLEVTATPFVESTKAPIPFKNVVMNYPLARAMEDGFVKEPAVVTQRNFSSVGMSIEDLEDVKLKDGIRLHENTKVELTTYANQTGQKLVKPFILVIARDTTHAAQLKDKIESDTFFSGLYKGKVIQVDSSKTGKEEEETTRRLLAVESPDEPTEIVIHVNMLKEGWDVTNLYTIIPLRAANARTLIEQSIGRGLRLPYGKRTKVDAVDRLSIVAHDRFQEIIDEANRDDSIIRLKVFYIDEDQSPKQSVESHSNFEISLGLGSSNYTPTQDQHDATATPDQHDATAQVADPVHQPFNVKPIFSTTKEQHTAVAVNTEIKRYATTGLNQLPNSAALQQPDVQQKIVESVRRHIAAQQSSLDLDDPESNINVEDIVKKVTELYIQQTIDIPSITVQPSEDVQTGFHPFKLNVHGLHLRPQTRELIGQNLRDHQVFSIKATASLQEQTPEDKIVFALIDFDDIDYFSQSSLLYDLAKQMIQHLQSYLAEDEVRQVVEQQYRLIANHIHAQMQQQFWEKASSYIVTVNRSFVPLLPCFYTAAKDVAVQSIRNTPTSKTPIKQLLFGGFSRCLYPLQKFDSDTERRFAIILERDSQKWFKPAKGQFKLYYALGTEQSEYVPDFVVETETYFLMAETKARVDINTAEVQAKAEAAAKWCQHASEVAMKPWYYVLIPHDDVKESMRLEDYLRFKVLPTDK